MADFKKWLEKECSHFNIGDLLNFGNFVKPKSRRMRISLVVFFSLTYFLVGFQNSPKVETTSKFQSEYYMIVIIDGPRFSETFGDTSYTYIPKMGRELAKEGVLFYNFRNNGPTYTNAGHTAITTGHYQHISNGGKQLPKRPSIFNYYLKSFNADKSDAYIVSSKGKLEILANTKNKKWWNTYMPMTYCGEKGNSSNYINDEQTYNKVNSLIETHMPRIMLVNFLAVDSYGHANEWEAYLSSIQKCDQFVYNIWNKIQSSPKLRNKTTLFITNDHGRHLDGHKDGFVNHGDRCEGCRHISLLAMGPDIRKNVVIREGGELIDISKTIAHMIGFDIPTSDGRVLTELFAN